MSSKLIEFQKISKIYRAGGVETFAVNNVDVHIDKGEYVVISGPSGGGKSSMLSIMGLLDKPTDGRYLFNGVDTSQFNRNQLAELRNKEMGFIFQAFNLIESMTVFENVALPLRHRSEILQKELLDRVTEALEKVGMGHRMKHFPSQLSGGQQQRVAVARAICGKPSIILADEPTGNLDSKSADTVMKLLREQHQSGVTICIVTHDPRYVVDATRAINVFDGSVINEANLDSAGHAATAAAHL